MADLGYVDPRIWGYRLDFGDIGDTLAGGVNSYMDKKRYQDAFKDGDYTKAFDRLLKAGDLEGAAKVAKIYELGQGDDSFGASGGRIYNKNTGEVVSEFAPKLSPSDKKASREARVETTKMEIALKTLKEAYGLLGEKGDRIYDQYGAGLRADIGTNIPFGGSEWLGKQGVVDRDKAMRTQKYLQIMQPESLKYLSASLKGPTSEKEMAKFMDIYSKASTPNEVKALMLSNLIRATEADLATQRGISDEIGGEPKAAVTPPQQAIDALMANPDLRDQFEEFYGISADEFLGQ